MLCWFVLNIGSAGRCFLQFDRDHFITLYRKLSDFSFSLDRVMELLRRKAGGETPLIMMRLSPFSASPEKRTANKRH